MKKYSIIAVTILFALSSVIFARSEGKKSSKGKSSKGKISYTKSSKSKLKLTAADVALIDKAIDGKFAELSSSEKDELVKFLKDFKDNASKEK